MDGVGDFFNELYYIYRDKYNEEKDGLNARDKKNFNYKKLSLTDDYQYESEKEEQQTSKKPDKEKPPKKLDKKEPPKKPTKDDLDKLNKWANKKETSINGDLFNKYFNFQRPRDILKALYITNDKKKNNDLVNLIEVDLSYLKNEIENMSEEGKEIQKPNEIVDIVEKHLKLND